MGQKRRVDIYEHTNTTARKEAVGHEWGDVSRDIWGLLKFLSSKTLLRIGCREIAQ